MKAHFESQIEEIMKNFNFKRVHGVMQLLNWTWMGSDVPSIEELKTEARKKLETLAEFENKISSMSGGLLARKVRTKEGDFLSLYFILEFWDA